MKRLRPCLAGLMLLCVASLGWGDSCDFPQPKKCANVGCVNDEMRSCESEADSKRLHQVPAGKENIDICLRKIQKDQSTVLTVDAVIAAVIACRNKNVFEP